MFAYFRLDTTAGHMREPPRRLAREHYDYKLFHPAKSDASRIWRALPALLNRSHEAMAMASRAGVTPEISEEAGIAIARTGRHR